MAAYPDDPSRILAGADNGVYRSEDRGATWEKLWSPMDGMPIWSIAIDPEDTETVFVGIKPAALFRTRDGGESWSKLSVQMAQECHIGPAHGDHAGGGSQGPPHGVGWRGGRRSVPQPGRRGHLDPR